MKIKHNGIILFFLIALMNLTAQENNVKVNTDWTHERHAWDVSWVSHPYESVLEYGVFVFRKSFELSRVPDSLIIYVSGDNRYRLFVNETEVSMGPARGDPMNWRYETLDISKYLKEGNNILAAEVYNLGKNKPVAQFSRQTAFILKAGEPFTDLISTGRTKWKVSKNEAFRPIPFNRVTGKYYVAGPCDTIYALKYPWGWKSEYFDDGDWPEAGYAGPGAGRGYMHGIKWLLVPRNIPPLEQKEERMKNIVRSDIEIDHDSFLKGKVDLVISAHRKTKILLDQTWLTLGFPELRLSKGKGSKIKVIYSEALYKPDGNKGNRNIIDGKEIDGYYDVFIPDGGYNRVFRPLWLRTFRFIQFEIETLNEELIIHDYKNIFTAYPLTERAYFKTEDPELDEIWDAGWRTARLCAGETFMDCPYWEQLQYLGDTRIQALVSLYVSGDDRLMRNALMQADNSRLPNGLTLARGPSSIPQITPPFSLYWVDMVHDYFMLRQDDTFIRQFLPGIKSVLAWFENRLDETGMLGPLDWFNFSDWTPGFKVGVPAGVDQGHTALISLNYVYALERASAIFSYFNDVPEAQKYEHLARSIRASVYDHCYSVERRLLADTPEKNEFSQHTNIFGILTNTINPDKQPGVMDEILKEKDLTQTTIYYKFYLFQALRKSGMAGKYVELLQPWKEMIAKGLTTFEEGDYDERSDCHAWGASPLYDFLATVCGIRPGSPGFKTVLVEPNPGLLKNIESEMPHPAGSILFNLKKKNKEDYDILVTLPEAVTGKFVWKGTESRLESGTNEIRIKNGGLGNKKL